MDLIFPDTKERFSNQLHNSDLQDSTRWESSKTEEDGKDLHGGRDEDSKWWGWVLPKFLPDVRSISEAYNFPHEVHCVCTRRQASNPTPGSLGPNPHGFQKWKYKLKSQATSNGNPQSRIQTNNHEPQNWNLIPPLTTASVVLSGKQPPHNGKFYNTCRQRWL